MHSRGWDRVGASRIVQGNHLPGRPGYQACDSWDMTTTTWLGPGFCCPLAAVWGTYRSGANLNFSCASHFPFQRADVLACGSFPPILYPTLLYRREREAIPRLPRRPPIGEGEPVLVLCGQPSSQRPVGGSQRWILPETQQEGSQPRQLASWIAALTLPPLT